MTKLEMTEILRKTSAGGRAISFAKTPKALYFAGSELVLFHLKSVGYDNCIRCMGCKGSSVRITPSRPINLTKKAG